MPKAKPKLRELLGSSSPDVSAQSGGKNENTQQSSYGPDYVLSRQEVYIEEQHGKPKEDRVYNSNYQPSSCLCLGHLLHVILLG